MGTQFKRVITMGAIGLLAVAGSTGVAGAGEVTGDQECIRFAVNEGHGPAIRTWGSFDLWVLEAGGEEFAFETPGAGSRLVAGNGLDIDFVRKCTITTPEPAPEPVAEEPAPEPVIEEPAIEEPAPEPVIEEPAVEEPAPEPVIEEPVVEEPQIEEPAPDAPALDEEPAPQRFGSSPTPEVTVDQPAPQPAPSISLPLPVVSGDAEVLGFQLANTGPQHVAPLAGTAVALIVLGVGCIGISRRMTPRSST